MRKASIGLLIAGLILVIAGNFFYHKEDSPVDNKTMTVTAGGSKSFKWPVYTGVILLFLGGTFYLAGKNNSKVQH